MRPLERRADRGAGRVRRRCPAGRAWRPTGWPSSRSTSISAGRIARASGRLGRDWPDLPALAYPPGFPLLAGARARRLLRAGRARRRRDQLHRRAAVRLPHRRARPHALHRPAAARPGSCGSSTPALLLFGPYIALALTLGRPARAGPQARQPLRRLAPHQPEPQPTSNGAPACRSFFSSASAASARWATWSTSRTATPATSCCRRRRRCAPRAENLARFEKDRAQLEARDLELKKEAEAVAAKLDGKTFLAIRQAGDTGQLYGSVTPRDIAELVTAGGFTVDRRQIVLDKPIKTLGLHPTRVALHPEVIVQVTPQRRPLRGRGRAPGARRGRDGGEGGGARSSRPSTPTPCSRRRRWPASAARRSRRQPRGRSKGQGAALDSHRLPAARLLVGAASAFACA